MSGSDQWVPDREWGNAVYDFVTDKADREKIADDRHAELMRIHREGWRTVADSISRGLGSIAEALRSR